MPLTLEVIGLVIYSAILVTQPTGGIVNNRKNSSVQYSPHFYPRKEHIKKKSYLEGNRPLWVLEDKVARPEEIDVVIHRPFKSRRKFISSSRYIPKLPSHYINLDSPVLNAPSSSQNRMTPRNHKIMGNQRTRLFPVFDDLEMDSDPILIYRGPKAEMIFNTMMATRKYPMHEPVPGQVMYPPYSPKFKPTPIVESTRPSDSFFQNLTLIPFYAHEAIDPRQLRYEEKRPEVVDNSIANSIVASEQADSQIKPVCYHSYYSQNDVQGNYWYPAFTTPPPFEPATEESLNHQLVAPDVYRTNHRMETTTQISHSPPDHSFRIVYDSEGAIEKPPSKTRYRNVHTAKYGGFKTIYPIYTLNKLLKFKPYKQGQKTSANTSARKRRRTQPSEETWIFYNTRRKSARTSNYRNPMTTKLFPKFQPSSIDLDTKILVQ